MAVSTDNAYSGPFLTNGVTTEFPFTFTAPSANEIAVFLRGGDGTESEASGYAVALESGAGGSVIFSTPPAAGNSLYIQLNPSFTQDLAFEDGAAWLAAPVNEGYDRSASRDQALKRDTDRAIKVPLGADALALDPTGISEGDILTFQNGRLQRLDCTAFANKFYAGDGTGKMIPSSGTGVDAGLRTDLAASTGSSLVAIGKAALEKRLRQVSVSITEFMDGGLTADCLAAFNAALAVVKAAGGGTIVFPNQGLGGWNLSDTAVIDASNITIDLYDDVKLTKTTKAQCFNFVGTSDSVYLSNVKLRCPGRKCTVDGNGSNMTGYTYDSSDGSYAAIHFFYCKGVVVENVHATNGLVNSLLVRRCTNITLTDCDGSHTVYDNGISVNLALNYAGYSATDPTTWTNARLLRCRGFNNNAVGITNYGGYGHTWIDCETWGNGQDVDPSLPHGGGMTVEINGSYIRDSRTTIINPKGSANLNYDLLASAPGVKVVSPQFKGTIKPTVVPDGTSSYGSSVIIFGNGSIDFSGYGTLDSPGLHGIRVLATAYFPSLSWDGQILNPGGSGISGQGINLLEMSNRSVIDGAAVSGVAIVNGSAPYNAGGGEARISGNILNCASIAIDITGLAVADVSRLRLKNNRTGATAGSQVRFTSVTKANATDIRNEDSNAKTQKVVEIRNSCVNGLTRNISGDSTTKTAMVDNSATNRIYTLGEDLGWDFILEEQAAAGTAGGSASAGRNTRPLGATVINRTTLATAISGGNFTLPAGTYRILARAQAYKVDEHTLYLRDTTNSADIKQGSSALADAALNVVSESTLDYVFTLTAATALQLEHYCKTARATDGLGKAMTTQPGRFAWLGIRKVA